MKKRLVATVLAASFAVVMAGSAMAAETEGAAPAVPEGYPEKDITVIVPKNPGGGTDTSTRGVLEFMSKENPNLKFNVVNNSDGGGITGMVQTANADPDGLTLGTVTVELDMFPFQGKSDLTYESFDSIVMPIAAPAALIVQGDAPYNSIDEFVEYCKENPGTVQIGNSGAGAIWDIANYLFEEEYGVVTTHVPYPGGTADIAAAITGKHIDATIADPSSFVTQIEAGDLKCLGVMADDRTGILPDVPTFKEEGHDLTVRAWATLVAPKGVDEGILAVLRDAADKAMNSDECQEYFKNQGIDPTAYVGEDADKIMADDYEMYKKVFSEHDFGGEE
ncbi:MAG: tripartite tricarboxylate transporter substrate binding protein [Lachnospiraceae bacterium]|nr:tripartite tricarboxylate transporter substrate binding protein [Lachnospiraceae bacterium]